MFQNILCCLISFSDKSECKPMAYTSKNCLRISLYYQLTDSMEICKRENYQLKNKSKMLLIGIPLVSVSRYTTFH